MDEISSQLPLLVFKIYCTTKSLVFWDVRCIHDLYYWFTVYMLYEEQFIKKLFLLSKLKCFLGNIF